MSDLQVIPVFNDNEINRLKDIASFVLEEAKRQGASDAEVSTSLQTGLSASVRLQNVETLSFERDKGVGVTVYLGKRKGTSSSSDTSKEALIESVRAACDIAKYTAEDEYAGLAPKNLLATSFKDLDLHHPWIINPQEAITLAIECEEIALQDKRITNSEGVSIDTGQVASVYGNTNGFLAGQLSSKHGLSCVLIAGKGDNMQRDYAYTVARCHLDLKSSKEIAQKAVTRTVSRLNPLKISTRKSPVIFASYLASGLISSFVGAVSGSSQYRKTSFLLDSLGKQVCNEKISIIEKPHLLRGIGSSAYDGEGVATADNILVKDGILQRYILSSYSARRLGMQTTANAGGITNLVVNNTDGDLQELFKKMDTGLYVTELMGQGVNLVTGDYSRGASGFWVENGEIKYPVAEITVAGNLLKMLKNIVAIGSDIDNRSQILTGSLLLTEMTIAGA